jgi:O-succinylbenzoate synthase
MHIDAVELFHLVVPAIGDADADAPCEAVLVRLVSGSASGWGEASPGAAPRDGSQWAGGVMAVLRRWMVPAVVGNDLASGDDLAARLGDLHGNSFAKGALDAAWWDLAAKQQGLPLHRLLGGSRRVVRSAVTLGVMPSVDPLLAAIEASLAAGHPHVTLEFRPGWGVEMLRAVRQALPTAPLAIDCDGGATLDQVAMFYRLEDFALLRIEQPLAADDLVGHAMLQESLRTPLCLDQSITSPARARQAMELGACRAVNVRVDRVGGPTAALAIAAACREEHLACLISLGPCGPIGRRTALATATLDAVDDVVERPASCRHPLDAICAAGCRTHADDDSATIGLWDEPGIGFEPDVAAIEQVLADRAVFRA